MNRYKVNWISKLLIALGVVSVLSTSFTAYAAEQSNNAIYYAFVYAGYGNAIMDYSPWADKLTTAPVYVKCETATNPFSVVLMGCLDSSGTKDDASPVSEAYYLAAGQSCNIVNTALTNQPYRPRVALRGIYQGDSSFRAQGTYIPN